VVVDRTVVTLLLIGCLPESDTGMGLDPGSACRSGSFPSSGVRGRVRWAGEQVGGGAGISVWHCVCQCPALL